MCNAPAHSSPMIPQQKDKLHLAIQSSGRDAPRRGVLGVKKCESEGLASPDHQTGPLGEAVKKLIFRIFFLHFPKEFGCDFADVSIFSQLRRAGPTSP